MSHPTTCNASPAPGDTQDIYLVHSSLTCVMHKVRALNEADALGKWLTSHSIDAGRVRGRTRTEPFYHLEAELGGEHLAHVALERVLETRRAGS
jgi:hypothetical protein